MNNPVLESVITLCQKWQQNRTALLDQLTVGNWSSATVQTKGLDTDHRLQTQHRNCRCISCTPSVVTVVT